MAAVSSGYSPLDHHGGEALQKADVGVPELSEGETSSSALQPKRSSEKTLRYAAVALCALFSFVAVLFLTRQHNSATEDAGLRSARHGPRLADTGEEIGLAANAAKIKSFYMYRVQNDEDYSPENQNMANVGGALWYLHNEIVWHHFLRAGTFASTPKTRIERYLVFTRATPQLYAKGMNFGVVNTYDLGQCTGPFKCENLQEYGPVVGCESWKKRPDGKMGSNFPMGSGSDRTSIRMPCGTAFLAAAALSSSGIRRGTARKKSPVVHVLRTQFLQVKKTARTPTKKWVKYRSTR